MKTIRIENYPNIYYIVDEKISKFVSDGVLRLNSPTFKKANKTPIKQFSLLVRVTKVIDGKQKSKKKIFNFTETTIQQALKELINAPEELLSQMKSIAEQKEAEEQQQREENANCILNIAWDNYFEYKTKLAPKKKWRESTANNYKIFYDKWIRETLGKKRIQEITKKECEKLINSIATQRALRTATTAIEVLRPTFDYHYEEWEIDKRNPVPSKENYRLTEEHSNIRVVDVALPQIKKLYEAMENYEDKIYRDMFMWIRTGRRRGEVVTLQMDTIDLEDNSFLIKAKNNKAKVDMEYKLRDELKDTLPKIKKGNIFPVHADSITKHWNRIKKQVGGTFKLNGERVSITELHLHDIRHIINGVLKKAEVPQEVREKVLGHKNLSINERYGVSYYGDIDRAYQLFINIVYGVIPEDTKWGVL